MKNRLILLWCGLTLFSLGVFAQEQERLSLSKGDSRTLETPFEIESYAQRPNGIVSIEQAEGENKLLINGTKVGECTLIVRGAGISKTFNITVLSNVRKVLAKLRSDLQDMTELDISLNQDTITINGTLIDYNKWLRLLQVLNDGDYKGVRNFATFKPSVDTILSLRQTFENAGYTLVETAEECKPGELCLKLSPAMLQVSGQVYSENDLQEIKAILGTQNWLNLSGPSSASSASPIQVPVLMKVTVAQAEIAVDIAFVAISKNEGDTLGGQPGWSAALNFDRLSRGSIIGSPLQNTLTFLGSNGITRIHQAGTVTFSSNSSTGGHLKIGGTRYVKVSGEVGGDLKEISYGFDISVKARMIGNSKVDLSVVLTNHSISTMGEDYDTKDYDITTSRICELNQTLILGGYQSVVESTSHSGFPWFRNVPVLQWFLSEKNNSKEQTQLLMLASPRLVTEDATIQLDDNIATLKPVVEDAQTDVATLEKRDREKRRKHTGWLSWLNWFTW